jgi:hypothetical protein
MADGEQEPSPNQQYRDRDAYFEGCHGWMIQIGGA